MKATASGSHQVCFQLTSRDRGIRLAGKSGNVKSNVESCSAGQVGSEEAEREGCLPDKGVHPAFDSNSGDTARRTPIVTILMCYMDVDEVFEKHGIIKARAIGD